MNSHLEVKRTVKTEILLIGLNERTFNDAQHKKMHCLLGDNISVEIGNSLHKRWYKLQTNTDAHTQSTKTPYFISFTGL